MGQKLYSYEDGFGNLIKDEDTVIYEGNEYRVAYISDLYVNLDGGRMKWLHLPFSVGVPYLKGGNNTKQGPVRTVTRKEIVPGMYGVVRIYEEDCDKGHACIKVGGDGYHWTATELRAAAATLIEIADALEDV